MNIREVIGRKPSADVASIRASDTMRNLVQGLREHRIGAMIVTDESEGLCGVISERDVVRALAEDGEVCLDASVSRYMTAEVVTTEFAETAESVLGKMTTGRFRHMPVMDGGRVAGVVSIGDLVKARIDSLERDNEALENFIRS